MRAFNPALSTLLLAFAPVGVTVAQTVIVQPENVRFDYAQVMRVDPIFQTLRASAMERQCDPAPTEEPEGKRISKIVGAVKGALRSKPKTETVSDGVNCRMVRVEREFRRPIAYDVDYVYKGMKYRSRMLQDPGHRLRIRISVAPAVGSDDRQ